MTMFLGFPEKNASSWSCYTLSTCNTEPVIIFHSLYIPLAVEVFDLVQDAAIKEASFEVPRNLLNLKSNSCQDIKAMYT